MIIFISWVHAIGVCSYVTPRLKRYQSLIDIQRPNARERVTRHWLIFFFHAAQINSGLVALHRENSLSCQQLSNMCQLKETAAWGWQLLQAWLHTTGGCSSLVPIRNSGKKKHHEIMILNILCSKFEHAWICNMTRTRHSIYKPDVPAFWASKLSVTILCIILKL